MRGKADLLLIPRIFSCKDRNDGRMKLAGRHGETGVSEAFFEDFLAPAFAKAEQEGCELYCGESARGLRAARRRPQPVDL